MRLLYIWLVVLALGASGPAWGQQSTLGVGSSGSGIPKLNGTGTNTTFYGQNFLNSTGSTLLYLGGVDSNVREERMLRGTWHDWPTNNVLMPGGASTIGHYLNSGAAVSEYFPGLGGSGGALADLPPRGPEIHGNQLKPYVVISTRSGDGGPNSLVQTTQGTVTNGVKCLATNGYTSFFTNLGIGMAYSIENGWCTNHRSASGGLLRINTNRFPMCTGSDTLFTNLTVYLATNRLESWFMMYEYNFVAQPQNWLNPGGLPQHSEIDVNPLTGGTPYWQYPGQATPFTTEETQPVMTFDSAHQDISQFYTCGARGLSLQDCLGASAGYFDQMTRAISCAALNPYYRPGTAQEIAEDAQWNRWYPIGVPVGDGTSYIGTSNAAHAMILNIFLGSSGTPWPLNRSLDANALYVESNGSDTVPTGSRAVGWVVEQFMRNSGMLTNASGYCRMIPGGDGAAFDTYTYLDWKSYFTFCGFVNCNYWLTVANSTYDYMKSAAFGLNFTNAGNTAVWQEHSGKPPTILSRTATSLVATRTLLNGDRLVWLGNENTSTANLTVTAGQLGIPSNTVFQVLDLVTNGTMGLFTNSYTETVPAAGANSILVRVLPTVSDGASNMQMVENGVTGSILYKGTNVINIQGASPNPVVSINTPADTGGSLTIGGPLRLQQEKGGGGNNYDLFRDGANGYLRVIGEQGASATGIDIQHTRSGVAGTSIITFAGDTGLFLKGIGAGLNIKTGSNAKIGTATLSGGAATVSNTSVTSNSRIFLCSNTDGGTPGWLRVSAKTAGTSFVITSSSGTDTSTVAWLIVESIP